jgi:hypothetical protein
MKEPFASDECSHDCARVRRDHAGRGGNDRRVCETFVRTAGTAREKVVRGSLLPIVTAGDDIEDEDIGDAEAIDGCSPQKALAAGETIRRRPLIQPGGKNLL